MCFSLSPYSVSAPRWSWALVAVLCLISLSKLTHSWKQTSEPVGFTFKMELIDSNKTQKVFSSKKLSGLCPVPTASIFLTWEVLGVASCTSGSDGWISKRKVLQVNQKPLGRTAHLTSLRTGTRNRSDLKCSELVRALYKVNAHIKLKRGDWYLTKNTMFL